MKILKSLGKSTKKKLKITSETYYLDIDSCPLTAWRKCYEVGYSAIRKEINEDDKTKTYGQKILKFFFIDRLIKKAKIIHNEEADYEAYNILYTTFNERIGVDESFQSYIDNMKAYILASTAYIKSRKKVNGVEIHDRSKLTKCRILLAKLQKFEKDGDERVIVAKVLNRLAKMQGVGTIKESDLTVLAYFELIKDYKEWVKAS